MSKSCDAVKRASVIIIGGSGSYNGLVDILRIELSLIKVSKGEDSCDAVKIVINIIRGAGSYNGLADRHHHNPTTGCCRSARHFVGLVILLCSAGNTLVLCWRTLLYGEYSAV